MSFYLSLPPLFLKFWFINAPLGLIKYFMTLNHAVLQILSLPLMVWTYFKPLKNEYRKGLVAFSIGMGIFVKTVLIFVDLVIFFFVILLEIGFLVFFIWWPAIVVLTLFIK